MDARSQLKTDNFNSYIGGELKTTGYPEGATEYPLIFQADDSEDVSKAKRTADYVKNQVDYLKRLSPEELKYEKIRMIIFSTLRDSDSNLTQFKFTYLFESFVEHFKKCQTLPPTLLQLVETLRDTNGLIKSYVEYYIRGENKQKAKIKAFKEQMARQ